MKNILFVCGRGRLRSPTAEQMLAGRADLETASAGISSDADNPLTAELVEWAEVIFVMEKSHRTKLQKRFRPHLRSKRVVCLDIPDKYGLMDPALVELLERRLSSLLP
jgi:predicted protein tyrosine phosphatase